MVGSGSKMKLCSRAGSFNASAYCQCWLQAGEVLGADLSHWQLTAAAGGIIVGCLPVDKDRSPLFQGRAGIQTIKELRF